MNTNIVVGWAMPTYFICIIAKVLSGLIGICVGDALGVPVEFTSRAER
ncbi:hypothetical protein [Scytonema sp. NUACC21]